MAEDLAQTKSLATSLKRVKDKERMSFSWIKQFKAYLANKGAKSNEAHKQRVEKKMLKHNDNFIRH
ncbi:hypothetical protein PI124_g17992 [Phytophthora idaei]|nr:hypothetical protein PI125_g18360 [Phytophthora idaei]KAG3237013.1 hypothetical protein PI124_g17992 [Phytophthora idaei]